MIFTLPRITSPHFTVCTYSLYFTFFGYLFLTASPHLTSPYYAPSSHCTPLYLTPLSSSILHCTPLYLTSFHCTPLTLHSLPFTYLTAPFHLTSLHTFTSPYLTTPPLPHSTLHLSTYFTSPSLLPLISPRR